METKYTNRGFALIEFEDIHEQQCSIQKSSIATDDCVWIGVDLQRDKKEGARMHINKKQAKSIIKILQKFVDTGDLPRVYPKL